MTGFLIVLGVVYVLGFWIWNHVYYGRRHGVPYPFKDLSLSALPVALAWPVTVFTHNSPTLCNHRDHVLERGAARDAWEAEEAAIARTLGREGRPS